MTFKELGLNKDILKAIDEQGYTKPTPIQEQAIPIVLEKHDILAAAQTGTGKTAAFTLPLLNTLSKKKIVSKEKHYVKALILTPTRELASQVAQNIESYSKYLNLKTAVIFGGVGINPQKAILRKGVDIVIATPGRLLDLVGQKCIDLSRVEYFVLDEADRMLDMGFIHDMKRIIAIIPKHRQTLLFSATFSDEIKKLSHSLLNNAKTVEVAKRNTSSTQVSQIVHYVNKDTKKHLLSHLINEGNWNQVLVFTRTKHGANKLAEYLNKQNITAAAIHGNKSQGARTKALSNFKSKDIRVLVATDIAARGIDIALLPHVVNFELPNVPEDYVHRIGRTGRAGNEGVAMSLVCSDEYFFLTDIEKLINKSIEVVAVDGFTLPKLAKPNIQKKTNERSNNRVKNKPSNDSNSRSRSRTNSSPEKNKIDGKNKVNIKFPDKKRVSKKDESKSLITKWENEIKKQKDNEAKNPRNPRNRRITSAAKAK
ncbi:MAG: ATP-dependent RNA helicase RhlE [Arcobacter sp.]|nr:ATP-dependent RNA helicase RhlE [Arcobacter sp.]|tara:strand:+ start:2720 stop:4168 length:1449 start_codon:yes stop_codon:yes gene_type:complete